MPHAFVPIHRRRLPLTAATLLALTAFAACGGGGGDGLEVASLGTAAPDDTADDGGSGDDAPDDADFEQAMLDFTECMRDHGIDMPDPQVSGNGEGGMVVVQEAEPGDGSPEFERDSEEFEDAQRECEHFMEDVVGEIEIDPQQQAEMQEEMLAFAECMREHGIDMPDPVFSEDGRVEAQSGDISDIGSDAFEEASEACGGGEFRAVAPGDDDGTDG